MDKDALAATVAALRLVKRQLEGLAGSIHDPPTPGEYHELHALQRKVVSLAADAGRVYRPQNDKDLWPWVVLWNDLARRYPGWLAPADLGKLSEVKGQVGFVTELGHDGSWFRSSVTVVDALLHDLTDRGAHPRTQGEAFDDYCGWAHECFEFLTHPAEWLSPTGPIEMAATADNPIVFDRRARYRVLRWFGFTCGTERWRARDGLLSAARAHHDLSELRSRVECVESSLQALVVAVRDSVSGDGSADPDAASATSHAIERLYLLRPEFSDAKTPESAAHRGEVCTSLEGQPKPLLQKAGEAFAAAQTFVEHLAMLADWARRFGRTDGPPRVPLDWDAQAFTFAEAFIAWHDLTGLLTPAVRSEARRATHAPPGGFKFVSEGTSAPVVPTMPQEVASLLTAYRRVELDATPYPTVIEAVADGLGVYFRNAAYADWPHPLEPDTERVTIEAKARATARQVAQGKAAEPVGWGADYKELMRMESSAAVLARLGLKTYGDFQDLMMREWKSLDRARGESAVRLLRCDPIRFADLRMQLIREGEAVIAAAAGVDTRAIDRVAELVAEKMSRVPDGADDKRHAKAPGIPVGAASETADAGMFTVADLAERFGVERADALRKRLDRWRKKNAGGRDWTENEAASSRESKYLYRLGAVKHLIPVR